MHFSRVHARLFWGEEEGGDGKADGSRGKETFRTTAAAAVGARVWPV